MPLTQAGTVLGRIECGPRRDGPLLDEDRRLLASLAGQAATAVRNLHLTAELSARLEVIRTQAAQLSASRARMRAAQDTERQRIQRDLHDGVQQDIVVADRQARAGRRERQRRGDQRADESLAEVQRDLGALLGHLREFAHAIHPPVLADQGLLEAIEAQAARLPIEVVIEAEPALRGVSIPQHVEAAAWFVVAEALTNAVKHAARAAGCRWRSPAERAAGRRGQRRRLRIRPGRRPRARPVQPGRPDVDRERRAADRQPPGRGHHAARRGPAGGAARRRMAEPA